MYLGLLLLQLLFVGVVLCGAPAADAEMGAPGLLGIRRRLQQLLHPSLGISFAAQGDTDAHLLARQRPLDKHHEAVLAGYTLAAIGQAVDGEVQELAFFWGAG